jgi:two-component system, LytTR family, response regulator
MYPCIIVDDEPKARKLLEAIIKEYCPTLTLLEMCEDVPCAVKAIKKHKPKLIFLDIEMPGHSGLELLDFFNEEEVDFSIIFTTAYNDYALQAFKFSAIDYILKPIQHHQLVEAVERFTKQQSQSQSIQLQQLKSNLNAQVSWEDKRIVVPNGQTYKLIKPADIVMIKAEAAYSELHFADGTKILASKNLKHFEELLSEVSFIFRCHKSFIVNIKAIKEYVKSDGGYLNLNNNLTASISPDKVDDFLAKLG